MTTLQPAADLSRATISRTAAQPFLRWPGGKRWLLEALPELFDTATQRLLDPFLGGGAFIFNLNYKRAVAGDINSELVTTFEAVRVAPEEVWQLLQRHATEHSREHYAAQRARRPSGAAQTAARFIYLNQTSFNGLHRVNKNGRFNVPMGDRKVRTTLDQLLEVSRRLSHVELVCADFQMICRKAGLGDLLILDPPYTVKHDQNGFVRYNENIFSWADQERLAAEARLARARGAKVVVTNANHKSVIDLYPVAEFTRVTARRASRVSARTTGRSECTEVVFVGRSLTEEN